MGVSCIRRATRRFPEDFWHTRLSQQRQPLYDVHAPRPNHSPALPSNIFSLSTSRSKPVQTVMATTKISRLIQLAKFQARLLSPRVSNCLICSSMNPLVFISYLEFYLIHHADEFKYSCTVKVPKEGIR